MGLIDASEFTDADGTPLPLVEGRRQRRRQADADLGAAARRRRAVARGRARRTLITNDQAWEGAVVEGPLLVAHGGAYWLFYSGNAYYDAATPSASRAPIRRSGRTPRRRARSSSTTRAWVGPGHCSVVDGPAPAIVLVYHAWQAGHVNGPGDGRLVLVDAIDWSGRLAVGARRAVDARRARYPDVEKRIVTTSFAGDGDGELVARVAERDLGADALVEIGPPGARERAIKAQARGDGGVGGPTRRTMNASPSSARLKIERRTVAGSMERNGRSLGCARASGSARGADERRLELAHGVGRRWRCA